MIYAYLENAGSPDMNVNGAVTPVVFKYTATAECDLHRINIAVLDNAAAEDPNGFFVIAALTNGLLIECYDSGDTLLQDFGTTDTPIKQHAELAALAASDIVAEDTTDTRMAVRWTFDKAGDALHLRPGDYFQISVRDNLTTIELLRMMLQGVTL